MSIKKSTKPPDDGKDPGAAGVDLTGARAQEILAERLFNLVSAETAPQRHRAAREAALSVLAVALCARSLGGAK